MRTTTITTDELTHALEQRREIDLVSEGPVRVTYDAMSQEYRVYSGPNLRQITGSPEVATSAFNDEVRR